MIIPVIKINIEYPTMKNCNTSLKETFGAKKLTNKGFF
jgi:hypothetical protein